MSKFNRGGQGGRRFDRGRGDRGFEKRMFSATCAECGDRCEVPFRPTGEKPVLCNNCFRGGDDRGARRERRFDRPRHDERPSRDNRDNDQLEQINAKLDIIMKELTNLKQPNKVHTLDSEDASKLTEEKPAKKSNLPSHKATEDKKSTKKTKKAKKEAEEATEEVAEEKPAKKAAKKTAKKETKKTAKKKAK